MAHIRDLRLPGATRTGLEPWVLVGESMALSAHARHATGDDEAHGLALLRACRESALRVFGTAGARLDYPAAGHLLLALGTWRLLRGTAPPGDALRLLALADRFGYNRTLPSMLWEPIAGAAEAAVPGRIGELRAEYAGREPADLLTDARLLAERLPG